MKSQSKQWYPKANENKEPSAWWYYGRAIYVSRHDYKKIFLVFISVGIPVGLAGLFLENDLLWNCALGVGALGLFLLLYSLFGLYRQYGHPAPNYFSKLLEQGDVKGDIKIADIHIGTYRHTYQLAKLLPKATVYSVDCWAEGFSSELAISDVRSLEPAPKHHDRIKPLKTKSFSIPLETASCDVIVFGFGTHEIPKGKERDKIFSEADRILKPGGKVLMFEHGIDFHNYLIFGPVIYHVTKHREWVEVMKSLFTQVNEGRMYAVNLISASKR